VLDVLFNNCQKKQYDRGTYAISIAGNSIQADESHSDFKDLNLLGVDFFRQVNAKIHIKYTDEYTESI
jgi:hypothetical protein